MKAIIAVLVFCSLSSVAHANDRASYCATVTSYAERIMFIRQMGQPIESQLRSVSYHFDTPEEQAEAQALVERAWAEELVTTSKKQKKQIKKFVEGTEEDCLAGKIFPS